MLSLVSFACIPGLKDDRLLILLSEAQRPSSLGHSHPLVTVSLLVTMVLMSTGLAMRPSLGQARLPAREEDGGGRGAGTGLAQRSGNPHIHRNQNSIRTACDLENIWLTASDHRPVSKCLAPSVPHPQRWGL